MGSRRAASPPTRPATSGSPTATRRTPARTTMSCASTPRTLQFKKTLPLSGGEGFLPRPVLRRRFALGHPDLRRRRAEPRRRDAGRSADPGRARDPARGRRRRARLVGGIRRPLDRRTSATGALTRLHAGHRGAADASRTSAPDPAFPIVDGDVVWLADWNAPRLVRVSGAGAPGRRSSRCPRPFPTCGVWSVAAGAGAVWATTPRAHAVWRIDPETNASRRISVPFLPSGVTVDANGRLGDGAEALGVGAVVEDRFDVVAVRVEHERAVVAGVVLGALAGAAVVAETGLDRRAVERFDRRVGRAPGRRGAGSRSRLVLHEREGAPAARDVEATRVAVVHA